ncbi:hypothetical protein ACCO45_004019 [Purpureocillium lilacinum]|uniref:Uncharacterized protein n=1 Tax=Purpureocillium lilacinum TaxID=33203 RepID=A0ACC4E1X5_PURLI
MTPSSATSLLTPAPYKRRCPAYHLPARHGVSGLAAPPDPAPTLPRGLAMHTPKVYMPSKVGGRLTVPYPCPIISDNLGPAAMPSEMAEAMMTTMPPKSARSWNFRPESSF